MKILHVISSVNPVGGGPIEGVKQIATLLEGQGHHIEVASLDHPAAPFVKECPLRVHPLGPTSSKYAFSSRFVPWLRANRSRYDAVVVNGIWQYHSFGAWRALRHSDTPYVLYPHGMLDPWFKKKYPLKHLKKWLYWPWADYRVLRDASAVLFTCEEECRLARDSFWLYRCNEVVVNYGTSRPHGDAGLQREEFLSRYPELRGKRLALFMGRVHPKKGCDLVIESFARVLGSNPDWHLLIAGPDQVGWQKYLSNRTAQLGVESRVTWTGMITGAEKWGALHSAEVFLLPSHQENFGIAVAEALASGVPTLISNKVNIWREILADGAGMVSDDTLEGACSTLRSYNDMPTEERTIMRQAARACFDRRFEITTAARSLQTVLSNFSGVN